MVIPERKAALAKAPIGEHPLAPTGPVDPSLSLAPPPSPAPSVGTVMLSARVPAGVRDRLKMHAVRNHLSVQEVVLSAVESYLAAADL